MKKNIIICFSLLFFLPAASVFAQAADAYYDFVFEDYIELETAVLEKYGAGTLERWDLGVIEDFRQEVAASGRKDIEGRLDILAFIVESDIENRNLNKNSVTVTDEIKAADQAFRAEQLRGDRIATGAAVAIGTAAVSGAIFAAAAILSSEFYSNYTQTEIADQAAFNLFWYQTFDRIALAGAVTGFVSGAAAAVLAALY